jgi:hypothetical protein
MSLKTVDEFGNTMMTVPCHCIGPLTFGEPIPDCESCHGSGLTKVVRLEPNPRPNPRESQIQTEVRLERERVVAIIMARASAHRSTAVELANRGYGSAATSTYSVLAAEFEQLAGDIQRGPVER